MNVNMGKKDCDHDFVTHWWCEVHGRFYGDAGDRHAMQCNKRQWSETKCDKCGYQI